MVDDASLYDEVAKTGTRKFFKGERLSPLLTLPSKRDGEDEVSNRKLRLPCRHGRFAKQTHPSIDANSA
jgi:hypothetical protein